MEVALNFLEFIILARIGNYGPHIVATILMVAFVIYLGHYKLKLPNYQLILFIVFAWQLHELLSQIPMNIARQSIGLYLSLYSQTALAVAFVICGFFAFQSKMRFRILPWLGFCAFLLIYMAVGWPITFPPYPQVFAVGVLENLYHASFALAFWSLFYG